MSLYGGIDLHANNSVVVLLNEQDQVIYQQRLAKHHPTHFMKPASHRPGRDVHPVFDLEWRRQGRATPARPTPTIGAWWRLEPGAQRAPHPG
jgi:hypothetical protein